jgi:predicted Zn-dependent protease with MMP-like domain
MLLGLYEGIPLTRRGVDYGMYPVVPDRITLFKQNIEIIARDEQELRAKIREVLIHEIGHYYGMSETEIRRAGY